MAAVTIGSDFGVPQNKVCHCFHFSPYLPWGDGTKYHDLHFLNVEFRQFFHSLLSPSSKGSLVPLPAIRVMSSASVNQRKSFSVPNSLQPHGLYSSWNSPGQNTGVSGTHFFFASPGIFQTRDQTHVSCIAGGFFTSWATREAQTKCSHSAKIKEEGEKY